MSPDTTPASATVTASVTDASSVTFTKSLSVARSLKTESIPVIVPLEGVEDVLILCLNPAPLNTQECSC